MVQRLIERANRRTTVGVAASIISFAYLISRLLGLLRDRLLVGHFGLTPVADAYTAAFRLPELMFTLLVSGAFAVAFIPVMAEHLASDEQEEAWRMASSLLNILVLVTIVAAAIAAIFADPLTKLIAPGFDPYRHHLTVDLTRIMLITPVLFAVSSVLGSVQQAYNRFTIYSFASIFYNVGIIFGIVVLANHYGIYGVAYGVVIGTVLQAALQLIGLAGLGYRWRPVLSWRLPGVRKVFKLMVPRSIDQGIDQIHYVVETIIGSRLTTGSLAAYNYANNLKNVPLVLLASAITTAAFPRMAANAAKGERQKLLEDYVKTARLILFLALPAAAAAVVMRGYIVRLLYGFGSPITANTLGWFAGTIVFTSLFMLVSRIYYALQDTRTPLYVSLVSIVFNVGFSLVLSSRYGVVGLAMASSLVAAFETITLLIILKRRQGSFGQREVWRGLAVMFPSALIMASMLYLTVSQVLPLYALDRGLIELAPKFLAIIAIGTTSYLLPCYLLRLKEARTFVGRVQDIILRPINLN